MKPNQDKVIKTKKKHPCSKGLTDPDFGMCLTLLRYLWLMYFILQCIYICLYILDVIHSSVVNETKSS